MSPALGGVGEAASGAGAQLERRAPLLAALIALVAALATMTSDQIGGFNDDGIYLLTAKALAEGMGYVYPHLPGHPPAIHYPPVWPLVLAAVWKVAPAFPGNIGWFKLINPVIVSLAAATAVHLGQRLFRLPWWVALGGVVAATVSVPVLLLTNLLLSEPLFLLLLLPTLLVAERLVREGGVTRALGAGALLALLVLVRTLGGAVLVATLVLLARDRRWREGAIVATVCVALLLPWQLFVWRAIPTFPEELLGSYGPYLDWVVDGYRAGGGPFLAAVVAKNADATWTMLGLFTSPLWAGPVRHAAAALALCAFAAGLLALAPRGRAPVTALAIAGYLAVAVVWPFWIDRFVWVVWPVLVLIGLAGGAMLVTRLRTAGRGRAAAAAVVVLTALALGHVTYNARGLARGWESSASRLMSATGTRLVRAVNDERWLDGQRIAAELAPMLALYTGLEVLPVGILTPREHVVDKTPAEQVDELERIDRRFRPAAYLVMRGGPYDVALQHARLDSGRTLIDVSPDGVPVRTLKVRHP